MKKLSDIATTANINSADTLLVLDAEGKTRRIYIGDLKHAVYSDDNFRRNLVNSLIESDAFIDTAKATIIALLEELGEMPEGVTQAFLLSLEAAQSGDTSGPLIPESNVTIGPNVTITIDEPEG